jgi:hypothetical protein
VYAIVSLLWFKRGLGFAPGTNSTLLLAVLALTIPLRAPLQTRQKPHRPHIPNANNLTSAPLQRAASCLVFKRSLLVHFLFHLMYSCLSLLLDIRFILSSVRSLSVFVPFSSHGLDTILI